MQISMSEIGGISDMQTDMRLLVLFGTPARLRVRARNSASHSRPSRASISLNMSNTRYLFFHKLTKHGF